MKEFRGYGIRVHNSILQNRILITELEEHFYLVRSIPNIFIIDKQSCSSELSYPVYGNWLVEVQHPSSSLQEIDEGAVRYIDALQDYLKDYNPSTNLIIYGHLTNA